MPDRKIDNFLIYEARKIQLRTANIFNSKPDLTSFDLAVPQEFQEDIGQDLNLDPVRLFRIERDLTLIAFTGDPEDEETVKMYLTEGQIGKLAGYIEAIFERNIQP